jgi:hypothetical protein
MEAERSFETLGCLITTRHYSPEDNRHHHHLQRLSLLACSVLKHEASSSLKKDKGVPVTGREGP